MGTYCCWPVHPVHKHQGYYSACYTPFMDRPRWATICDKTHPGVSHPKHTPVQQKGLIQKQGTCHRFISVYRVSPCEATQQAVSATWSAAMVQLHPQHSRADPTLQMRTNALYKHSSHLRQPCRDNPGKRCACLSSLRDDTARQSELP
jgi:hypothetical protein